MMGTLNVSSDEMSAKRETGPIIPSIETFCWQNGAFYSPDLHRPRIILFFKGFQIRLNFSDKTGYVCRINSIDKLDVTLAGEVGGLFKGGKISFTDASKSKVIECCLW